jgi:hypothetical protein
VFRELGQAAEWRSARRALWSFALPFPTALPAALLEEAHAQRALGRSTLARGLSLLARRCAVAFHMAGELERIEIAFPDA